MNTFSLNKVPQFSARIFCRIAIALIGSSTACSNVFAGGPDIPENLDGGLRKLIVEQQKQPVAATPNVATARVHRLGPHRLVRDKEQRVFVTIHLNGTVPLSQIRERARQLNARVTAESDLYRSGVLSAFVPVEKLAELAGAPGVLSISASRRPISHVGKTTSGGVYVMRTDTLNAQGLDGTGETIGALSGSYDVATLDENGDPIATRAADDVMSRDLPGTTNPDNPNPVYVLQEFDQTQAPDETPVDEGRAMLQIVHDVAPKAKLAFATGVLSEVGFANNIRRLRTDPAANCDVIVDDLIYFDEPFFSDGIVAQAVDDVVNSTTLPGHKCAYFATSGNEQGAGYTSTFTPVSNSAARAGIAGQNLKLGSVPQSLTSGGFHNFNPNPGTPDISQTFLIPDGTQGETEVDFIFQWNDPYDKPNGVTTDYNILIFDAAGNYRPDFSGKDNNFNTQRPLEMAQVTNDGPQTTFQVVIARSGNSPSTPVAKKLRYFAIDLFDNGIGASEYYQPNAPATYGHACAKRAFAVAAYLYDSNPSNPVGPPFTPLLEDFCAQGPATIDFDKQGNRLAQSEIRMKPDIAAPDGGNTTFFPAADPSFDYEGDGFPNFFGTSAAAPHAAGLAALLLQKAGGPSSLTYNQLKNALQSSPIKPHDLDPFFIQGTATKRTVTSAVTITGFGNRSNASANDPNFFTIHFSGAQGESLKQVTINIAKAGLGFDTTAEFGFPFTLGKLVNISPASIKSNAPAESFDIPSITVTFAPGSFSSSTSVSFGIDRDYLGDGAGNGADLLQGASISATTTTNSLSGQFLNQTGFGFSIIDGFGLIDGVRAAQAIP